jgi:hypothetical protein
MRIGDQAMCAVDPEWENCSLNLLLVMAKGAHGSGSSRTLMAAGGILTAWIRTELLRGPFNRLARLWRKP